jgi:hypothetical protein
LILFQPVGHFRVLDVTGIRVFTDLSVKYIPAWFPGMRFKKEASDAKRALKSLVDTPFQFTLHEMVFPNF